MRLLKWLLAGTFSVAVTGLIFLPATWIASRVEQQTAGRVVLGNVQGTLWRGSAVVGAASGRNEPVVQLLPGRFSWQLSPMVLLGRIDLRLHNPAALAQPVHVTGSWNQWQASPSAVDLPAERLAGLGAPLNTIQPSGEMRLSWNLMQFERHGRTFGMKGTMTLEMHDIASRLSPVKPLGAYRMVMDWRGQQAQVSLATINGPLLLTGTGKIAGGRFQFSGRAEAEAEYEERLANLLNLLGQRRREGNKDVIALEFK